MFTIGSLFAGIGGFDYAFTCAGFQVAWQVEKDDFCQQVLAKHFPDVPRYADVFDCHHLPHTDVICAGFPCQPFSQAGQQRGQDDERYLVPELLRIIHESQPTIVLLENVKGFTSLNDGAEFRLLLRQIADMGYDAQWGHLRASDIGAPHRRERWFLVAYRHQQRRGEIGQDGKHPRERTLSAGHVSDTHRDGCKQWFWRKRGYVHQHHRDSEEKGQSGKLEYRISGKCSLSNTAGARWKEWKPSCRWAHETQIKAGMESQSKRCGCVGGRSRRMGTCYGGRANNSQWENNGSCLPKKASIMGNSHSQHDKRCRSEGQHITGIRRSKTQLKGSGIRFSGQQLPVECRLGRDASRFSYRLDEHIFPAYRNQEQHDFEPPRTIDRRQSPGRKDRLKALGNAVVPQVVYPIALSIREYLEGNLV